METSLGDESSKKILKTVLLGSNRCFHALENLVVVSHVLDAVANLLFEELVAVDGGLLITDKDLRWMETHLEEALCLCHKFTSKADNKVGAISAFVLLHLSSHSNHLGGWVMNITLLDDGGSIRGNE
jgi:hypothetical protein